MYRKIVLILFQFLFLTTFACNEASFTLNSETDNGDGTYTYNFDICIEVTGLESWPDWFQVKFVGGTFTSVVDNSWNTPTISSSTGDDYNAARAESNTALRWTESFTFPSHCCNTICTSNITVNTNGKPTDIDVSFHDTYGGDCDQSYNIPTLLPIELLDFKTELIEPNLVEISWVTGSEINNDYFTVEKYIGGDWFEMDKVYGAGFSTISIDYKTYDLIDESGLYYYRLKQTDFDGRFEYFDIVTVEVNIVDEEQIKYLYIDILGRKTNKNYKGFKIIKKIK
jgi:hypothetical protein